MLGIDSMIDKKHIESVLKVNGVGASSPDDQIRSVLISARYGEDEVETALMVLRENTKTNETHVDGLHKVFRTDQNLKSSEIYDLLGIDTDIKDFTDIKQVVTSRRFNILQVVVLWSVSLILALTVVLFYMYSSHSGLFHPSVNMVLMSK